MKGEAEIGKLEFGRTNLNRSSEREGEKEREKRRKKEKQTDRQINRKKTAGVKKTARQTRR